MTYLPHYKFYMFAYKSSSLAFIGTLSSTVNHHSYYFLLTQFFHNNISDLYSTCLNLQFLLPLVSDFFFMSMHMDKAKCASGASYAIQ